MSPDSPESRLGRLETAVARLEQRADDLRTDVSSLMQLPVAVAELRFAVQQLQADQRSNNSAVRELAESYKQDKEARQKAEEDRRADDRRDSRSMRNTLIGVGVAAILSPLGTYLITLIHHG